MSNLADWTFLDAAYRRGGGLAANQRRADAGVAAADDEKMHDDPWRIECYPGTYRQFTLQGIDQTSETLKSA
jgi:hypothetical protein